MSSIAEGLGVEGVQGVWETQWAAGTKPELGLRPDPTDHRLGCTLLMPSARQVGGAAWEEPLRCRCTQNASVLTPLI